MNGKRMPRPDIVEQKYYDLMMKCWKLRPRQRPTSGEIVTALKKAMNVLIDSDAILDVSSTEERQPHILYTTSSSADDVD